MGVPTPINPLTDHCSIVHDNTLYVYSPAGFQSLELREGAKWQSMPMDVSLTGAECVKVIPRGDRNAARLYVVGGSVNETASTWDYPGLMHYTFATKKWDWVRAKSWVTQNRKNHAVAYLPNVNSLLVYSGSQTAGNTGPSSSTFTISLDEPYYVGSSSSNGPPPSVKPMLMPWDADNAVMVGGTPDNQNVYLFGPEGWRNLSVTLTQPIPSNGGVQCTLVSGEDGSKVLEKFDLSKSPNEVTRIVLLDEGGKLAPPGKIIGGKSKRVTLSNWPTYNNTFAPTTARSGFHIAQEDSGVAVITGGSDQDPIVIFDQKTNAWVNATTLFNGEQVLINSTPSSTVSSTSAPSSTGATAPSSTAPVAAAPAAPNNKTRMLTVLGATLGAIFGIAAILILLLFCLKYRKAKNRKEQQTGYVEKDRLSFADRGAEFMHEAGGSVGHHYNGSQSSLAIVSGQANHKRGLGSDASTSGLVMQKSPLGYSEPMELSKFDMKPGAAGDEKLVRQNSGRVPHQNANVGNSRSSGWSKYFANNEATNLAHMPSERSTYASDRTSMASQSMYPDSRMYSHPSQAPAPLDIPKFDGQRLSRVPTGSPTLGDSRENLAAQPMQAELARANSNGSTHSNHDNFYARDGVNSWTPVGDDERPASSLYTNSMVMDNSNDGVVHRGTSSYYPDGTTSYYPKSSYSSFYPMPSKLGQPEGRESTMTMFPGQAGMPEKPFYPSPPKMPAVGEAPGRESTDTVFPGGAGATPQMGASTWNNDPYYAPPKMPVAGGMPQDRESTLTVFPNAAGETRNGNQQDMSWLNLGAGK